MTDATEPTEHDPKATEPVVGFDQTNGLAGDLVGDSEETSGEHDDDQETDVGSIYTGGLSRGVGGDADTDSSDSSDGEEPI
ncbi:hypothetical protein [Frondihabitans sp. PAMC 28766]|uniref:hypothetical protein n=1 Tax=Frondihabitans sp. PAMC 28766 TaxID=1795630 RepID=UPI0012FF5DBB|nr:hypothetical protein [Frondihabitans sp. PAMC 28766]